MSRALDKDVLKLLSHSDSVKVYDDIASLFDPVQDHDRLLEIEVLGKAHPLTPQVSYLKDENAVGIPKTRLFQAFSVAYERFKKHVIHVDVQRLSHDWTELLRITAVLLLADPEHLTAANTRKRVIRQAIQNESDTTAALMREKWFADSLLTSRLHRHTKSPVLWSHRRWLLSQFQKHGVQVDVSFEIRNVVLVSGERHPRNYYAWDHARWLLRIFVDAQADETARLQEMIADVKVWCLRHHDDISGWTFLHFLLCRGGAELGAERSSAFRGILQMAESFRWQNESVWWFMHAMAATSLLTPEDVSLLEEIGGRMFGNSESEGFDSGGLSRKWFRSFRGTQAI